MYNLQPFKNCVSSKAQAKAKLLKKANGCTEPNLVAKLCLQSLIKKRRVL